MGAAIANIDDHAAAITVATNQIGQTGMMVADQMKTLLADARNSSTDLEAARTRIDRLQDMGETMVRLTVAGGAETEDTAFVERAHRGAAAISELFEQKIEDGTIGMDALFDESYLPIDGSNPLQHMTRFVAITDRHLPAIQEAMLGESDRIVFCAAVDRNGFLPIHNQRFSNSQTDDPAFNAANCRNRCIFDDRVGLRAGRNTQPFCLQSYRRDMGNGAFVLMKDVSAPIMVKGRHWGAFCIGYKTV